MEVNIMKILRLLCILCLVLGVAGLGYTQEMTKRTATVSDFKGNVEVKTSATEWAPAKIGLILNEGDAISTKTDSWALLSLDGAQATATVEVKSNSQLKLAELIENKAENVQNTLLDLSIGEILIKAKKVRSDKSKFEVKTPTSIVGVKGTTFSVTVEAVE
jgi:hypothetical protein